MKLQIDDLTHLFYLNTKQGSIFAGCTRYSVLNLECDQGRFTVNSV